MFVVVLHQNLKQNKMNRLLIKVIVFALVSNFAWTQAKQKSFDFKKGEVLDILLIKTKANTRELFDIYKKTIFPVGVEYTFQPQPSFAIKKITIGHHTPNSMIIGKWENIRKREGFLNNIVKRVPDFHEQRRGLFEYFGLTFYKMEKDIKFSVDSDKFNIGNAFWGRDKKSLEFYRKWEHKVKKAGGEIILKLENGVSPVGYYYNADVFYIIAWKNKDTFEMFAKKNPLHKYEDLKSVHQFIIK